MSFGEVCPLKYSERWTEKPSRHEWRPFFFFLEITSIWKKNSLNVSEDLFLFFGDHLYLERKTVSSWVKTFFFGDHLYLDRKTVSIWVKTCFFFWSSPLFGQKKRLICQATFKSCFGQKFGAPPNHFEPLRPWHFIYCISLFFHYIGVEDTRLEAKGKNAGGQGPRTQRGSDLQKKRTSKKKKKGFCCTYIFRKIQAFFKKKKKDLRFKRSPGKKISSKNFSQALWRCTRRNKIGHDLGPLSTSQKLVLSSSRGQGIFEDLHSSRARPRTLNYVLEDSTSAPFS